VFPRALVVAGGASRAQVIETYAGDGGFSLTAPLTELVVSPGAVLEHVRVQDQGLDTSHVAVVAAAVERDARLASHAFSLGAALCRTDVSVVLEGEGATATLNGLSLVTGAQHVDTALKVRHACPHTSSRELYKGILDGSGRAVFTGRIVVEEGAQKIDALQSNRNLLLSDRATVNSNPQLEILADDVRCTHGSTVGRLDDDALFYLRARGLDLEAARSLLTWAFASEVVNGVGFEPLRSSLARAVLARLPGGELLAEAV
jgi:Fe-S cluster assembly protein SufD